MRGNDLETAIVAAALALGLSTSHAQELEVNLGDRADAYVAATPGYVFYSDFWLNLHDYLYWLSQEGGPVVAGERCLATLTEEESQPWQRAKSFYQANMGQRHHRRDPLMRSIRYTFADLAIDAESDTLMDTVLDLLIGAAPAYAACFWPEHDARNRERIASLVTSLVTYGPQLHARLSAWYQEPWPAAIPVDVVSYSDFAGVNTASGRGRPAHTTVSSSSPSLEGFSGLELVLHEASHVMFGGDHGTVGETIKSVSDSLGVPPPHNLWHAISFYTSGYAVNQAAADVGQVYEAYAERQGVHQRAWPMYLEPIERYWNPYLDGQTELRTALTQIIRAIQAEGQ